MSRPAALAFLAAISLSAQTVDFQRQIRPILSDNCFHCHGPDKSTRMFDLRLDTRDGAFEIRKSGSVIVPGKPASSLLYQRITAAEPARIMPPAHAKKSLTAAQKDLLKRWIEQGAPWKEHWAFAAPKRSEPPSVRDTRWARNPIDRFILARLDKEGLTPAPEADRRTLARRLSLDLTGLPPSPEEVETFVKDNAANWYEKFVDRLLESDHYGEHRARYWLDAARYADTHGLHIDNYREMWPYRDWVINAFNRNLPFDRFVIEQLAGDLLPNRTMEQQIATGFHRCNVTTNEGGVIPDEVAAIYAKDRVDTTGSVFLGLTIGCATCHDHKFDPILQKDFYSLAAFFRNTTQNPLDGNIPDTPPILVVPKKEDMERWTAIPRDEEVLRTRLAEARATSATDFANWLEKDRAKIATPIEAADELFALNASSFTLRGQPLNIPLPEGITTKDAALEFATEAALDLPNLDWIEAGRPFSLAAKFRMPTGEGNFTVVSQIDPRSRGRGWTFEINGRVPTLRLAGIAGRGLQIRGSNVERLKPGEWVHIAFSYDGHRDLTGMALFVNGVRARSEGRGESQPRLEGDIRNFVPLRIGGQGAARNFKGGALADLRIFARTLDDEYARLVAGWPELASARAKPAAGLTAHERAAFEHYFLLRENSDYIDLTGQLARLAEERLDIQRRGAITHVMQEKDTEPFANILYRGMYDQPREKVTPATPVVLPPMTSEYPRNRLGLAQWLVSANNPLTARVAVNRYWQEIFGTGIVKTVDDFGAQGEPPSHPELLDWLAVEFRESGWDVKKMVKMMVTSAAYRQSSRTTEPKLAKDPDNRLLSRGPRFRMDAEMIRDAALTASGLLTPTIGGPSVKPYQPDAIWETVAMTGSNTRFYKRDAGDKLYRRSLYTFLKRSAPPPAMEIFNATTRETCTVRRERTDTPLQALAAMNDVQYVEAARVLAGHALKSAPANFDAQLDFMTAHLVARRFDGQEREAAKRAHHDFLRFYDGKLDEAKKLITQGDSQPDPSLPAPDFAAMTMLANQLMNLDEVLNK
jgi:hypothetical protein